MEAALDSSSLISLAWSGHLGILQGTPMTLVVPDLVREETVDEGLARGHPDAAAIEAATKHLTTVATRGSATADSAVLEVAASIGVVITNDIALGRRAANLGARWLRTPDLVLICVRAGSLTAGQGQVALEALHAAGRISDALLADYREEV